MAHGVVGVAAVVGRDPAERRGRGLALEIVVQAIAGVEQVRDVRCVAIAGLEDRVKPREREVLGHVLVGGVGAAGVGLGGGAGRAGGGIRSAAVLHARAVDGPAGVGVAEILGIALPAHARLVELVEQRRHAGRVHAAIG